MKKLLSVFMTASMVSGTIFLSACEQQSASVTAPEAYAKKQAAHEKAAENDPANPNPPTFFGR